MKRAMFLAAVAALGLASESQACGPLARFLAGVRPPAVRVPASPSVRVTTVYRPAPDGPGPVIATGPPAPPVILPGADPDRDPPRIVLPRPIPVGK